jgi:hypothetical protein
MFEVFSNATWPPEQLSVPFAYTTTLRHCSASVYRQADSASRTSAYAQMPWTVEAGQAKSLPLRPCDCRST